MTSETTATLKIQSATLDGDDSSILGRYSNENYSERSTSHYGAAELSDDLEAGSSPRPRQPSIMAQWLCDRFEWTYFVTLTNSPLAVYARRPSADIGLAFRAGVEQYYSILSSDIYGRKTFKNSFVKHATFFENLSRRGNPTAWHAHSLVYVAQPFADRFVRKAERCWARRISNRTGAILIENIDFSKLRVADYCSKHDSAYAGIEPLFSEELEDIK